MYQAKDGRKDVEDDIIAYLQAKQQISRVSQQVRRVNVLPRCVPGVQNCTFKGASKINIISPPYPLVFILMHRNDISEALVGTCLGSLLLHREDDPYYLFPQFWFSVNQVGTQVYFQPSFYYYVFSSLRFIFIYWALQMFYQKNNLIKCIDSLFLKNFFIANFYLKGLSGEI